MKEGREREGGREGGQDGAKGRKAGEMRKKSSPSGCV
jgi:hypothetical protein